LENREWWPILGNYPGTGYSPGTSMAQAKWDELYPDTNPCWSSQYNFHPWIIGPNTAHIVWKRQGGIAGLTGGPAGQLGVVGSPSNPSLIYAGRAYDYYTNPNDGKTYMRCYDIRTGEVYFETLAVTTTMNFMGMIFTSALMPTYITYTRNAFTEVPGATADVTYGVELVALSGSRLYKWNPWTGQLTVNVSVSPLTGTFHNQMEGYVLGVVGGRLINWTTAGTTTNVTARIVSNTTYSGSSLPSLIDWNEGLGCFCVGNNSSCNERVVWNNYSRL
jgi:hypothetical protein